MTKKAHADHIVFSEETTLEEWCRILNCEPQDLLYAMSVIGSSFPVVDLFLTLNRKKKT